MGNDLHHLLVRPAYDGSALIPSVPFESVKESRPVCIAVARIQKKEEDKAVSSRVQRKKEGVRSVQAHSSPSPEVDVEPDFGK